MGKGNVGQRGSCWRTARRGATGRGSIGRGGDRRQRARSARRPPRRARTTIKFSSAQATYILASLFAAATMGCGQSKEQPGIVDVQRSLTGIPIASASLNLTSATPAGLLKGLGPDGWPILDGDGVDPLVLEARRFYDTLGTPPPQAGTVDFASTGASATASAPTLGATAPLTLDAWKTAFGFSPQRPDEDLQAFRARTNVAIYYNKNELGLGRELGCAPFIDGTDGNGDELIGVACYVTNHGAMFRDQDHSLQDAIDGTVVKNTVCISYRPSFPASYQIQFYVYGHDGSRQDWAQLDTLGPRPAPHVCMNCHGGQYDESLHLAKNARFLPLDPNLVVFARDDDSTNTGYTRTAQEERVRVNNALAALTPLSPGQKEAFDGLYAGQIATPGATSLEGWAPRGWRTSADDQQFYGQVVKPYCVTCHLAMPADDSGTASPFSTLFSSSAAFKAFPMLAFVCNDFIMPNAQATMHGFWGEHGAPVTIGAAQYATAADAMLAYFGASRESCNGLPTALRCDRADDPDRLCGDMHSGSACNRDTGRCVPSMFDDPAATGTPVTGVCRMDGARSCPYTLTCQSAGATLPGLADYDGTCVHCGGTGEPACAQAPACEAGLTISSAALCAAP